MQCGAVGNDVQKRHHAEFLVLHMGEELDKIRKTRGQEGRRTLVY